jgi:peroxiredoxin Q/BCP
MPNVETGVIAPDFTVQDDTDRRVSLSDFRGKWVVLFFYPKDDTSGCTIEACEFRDALPRFTAGDAVILGISPDDAKSHRKFKAKFELPYTLLVDEGHVVAERYGVWKEKSMYGRTYMGVERTTFLIDRAGRIARVFGKVKPEGHAEEVRQAIEALD